MKRTCHITWRVQAASEKFRRLRGVLDPSDSASEDIVVEHTGDGGKVVFRHRDGEEETLRLI
jgi:hypothetical protein